MASSQDREAALVALILEKPTAARAAFLDVICDGDAGLRQRLEQRLVTQDSAKTLPSAEGTTRRSGTIPQAGGPTLKIEMATAPDEAIGQAIGRYKLLEKVGEGGCGVVYVAEQTEPVRRRVALKVIKLGMDTKAVVARFEAERQALAMMDHPNIAKVLDAGTTQTGRPYFVMELVRGIKITDYCDQNNLPTAERLDLFIKVCQAIQHAHQKGIIHRDIKPSNILVTLHDGVPVPKVIDFGIAKATEGRLTDATVYTQLHQFIGTPAYMSPEQAEMSGLDIDTRSDIYSLGVLLYELLVGRTPFDATELMSQGIDAMRKTIREKDPVRPSTKLATLQGEELTTTARRRAADAPKLIHQLRGDLDWIVMKCLEKDRTRRYETANGVAMDIRRHLHNEPVLARPPSKLYEFQKTFRRHKFGFAAAAALMVVLAAGVLASTWQAILATRAKRDALSARQRAEINERKAVDAQANEAKMREQAQAQELVARRRAYASDMNVAQAALVGHNLGRALDLLNRQRPQPGHKDLRGWEWRYLWQQTRSDAIFTLCQQSSEVFSLALSADGSWLAIGGAHNDGVAVRDLRARQELIRLAKGEAYVSTAFSPTEPLLAFAGTTVSSETGSRTSLRLWNTATRQLVGELALDGECRGLAFSRDGRTLVTSTSTGSEGQITLWRMPEATRLASYISQQDRVEPATGFATTPDLGLAAYGSPDGQLRVIDLHNGKELWTAKASKDNISALAFSPDGGMLASAAGFGESDIRLWEVPTGKELRKLEGHGSWVGCLVFWPDGGKLASSSADQTIRTWDVGNGQCLDVLHGHRQEVWRLALLPDNKTLVTGAKDGTVCFWDVSVTHQRQPLITLPANVLNWGFAADGQSLLTLDREGQLLFWRGPDFQQQEVWLELGAVLDRNYLSSFSADGRLFSAGSTNGTLRVWDLPRRVLSHQLTNATGEVAPCILLGDASRLITSSSIDGRFHEWNLTSGVELQSWQGPASFQGAMDLSPDRRSCVVIGHEGSVVCRNLEDHSNSKLDLDALEAVAVSFSPDGKLLAVASDLGYARVWDAATWKPVVTLGGFLNGAHSVSFSPDGKRLAVASDGKEAVRLWDTEGWQDVFTLEGEGTGFSGLAFSPDGNSIVWGNWSSTGTTLYVWRAPSWAEINAAEAATVAPTRPP